MSSPASKARRTHRRHRSLPSPKAAIERARALQHDDAYLAAIDAARAEWNRDWSMFPVDETGEPPTDARTWDDLSPFRFVAAGLGLETWPPEQRTNVEYTAHHQWRELTDSIAREWWKLAHDPVPRRRKPRALRFVAACLLWGPAHLDPADWIEVDSPASPPTVRLWFNPLDESRHPEAVYYLELHEGTMRRLHESLEKGEAVSIAALQRMGLAAMKDAEQARASVLLPPGHEHLFLVLSPDILNTARWQQWESAVMDLVERRVPFSIERARELRQQGMILEDIGNELGVSRQTAANWTKAPDDERETNGQT